MVPEPKAASSPLPALRFAWALLLAFSPIPLARAAEATLSLQDEAVYEGQATVLKLDISSPTSDLGQPQLEPVAGLVIRGPSGPSRQTFILQGRTSSQVSYSYVVNPSPGKAGSFVIGPATVPRRGGGALTTNTVELKVLKRPREALRFGCAVTPPGGPVGAAFRVVYTIYYAGEPGGDDADDFFSIGFGRSTPFGLSELSLPILTLGGVRITKPIVVRPEVQASRLQFRDGSQVFLQPGSAADSEGAGYKTLTFGFEVVPLVTGAIEIPAATVGMRMQTGRVRRVRDFFTVREVPEVAEFKATAEAVKYIVKDLPTDGRPPGFTGAIGRWSVDVKASPTDVDAYAPIELQIRVTGDGLLQELRPPAFGEIESLTKDFQLATDVDSGKVEGNSKVFRQVVRPLNEKVTQIPPIPFPYFDPAAEAYKVALSKPIPITVHAVKTVTGDEAIPSVRAVQPKASLESPAPASIAERPGIGANFTDIGDVLPALDPRDSLLSAPFLAALLAPPALYGLLVALRLRRRDPQERARLKALAEARSMLRRGADPSSLCEALEAYFRARLELPAGEITPPDLSAKLVGRGAPAEVSQAAAEVLEKLLAGRFGGVRESPQALREEALEIVAEVDRCRLG